MNSETQTAEDVRLGGSSPFVTIMKLCLGPLLYQLFNGVQDSLDLYIMKRGFGSRGVTIVSIASGLRTLVTLVSTFASSAATIKTGELIAKHEFEKAGKLFVEFVRVGLILGIILPILLIPSGPMIITQLGITPDLKDDASKYLFPIYLYPFFAYLFSFINGILMSMGFAILSSVIQVLALLLALGFDALFIWGFHASIAWMGVCFVAGPTTVCLIMFFLFVFNRFAVKPIWSAFVSKPSPEFWAALKLTIPTVVMILFTLVCPLIVVGFVTKASKNIGLEKIIPTVYSTTTKAYTIMLSCSSGAISGLVPCATWAFTKNDLSRFTKLIANAFILPGLVVGIMWPLMVFGPKVILKIWVDDPTMLEWIPKISPIMFYTTIFDPINGITSMLLVVMGHQILCALGMMVKNLALLISGAVLFAIKKNSPRTVLFCYAFQDSFFLICNVICFIIAFKKSRAKAEEQKQISANLLSEGN